MSLEGPLHLPVMRAFDEKHFITDGSSGTVAVAAPSLHVRVAGDVFKFRFAQRAGCLRPSPCRQRLFSQDYSRSQMIARRVCTLCQAADAGESTPDVTGQIVASLRELKCQPRFHSFTSGPFVPITGSAFGSFTFGIVFNALAWFSGVARVISAGGPGG